MGVAVVDFQRTGHDPRFRQRDHQHRVDLRRAVGFIIVFDNDIAANDRLFGGRADGIIIVVVVIFPHANVGQHALGIGNCYRVGMNILADDVANLS